MKTIRQDPGSLTEKKSQCEWMLGNSTHTTPGIKALIGVVGVGLSITANISNLHFLYLRTSPPPPPEGEWVQSACRRTQASSAQRSSLPNTDIIKREGTNAMTISNDISNQHEGTKLDRTQALRCQRT